ncbi:MAG: dihydrolipoyllysine-residue acetyltransferase [Methylobacteriaceae bacterium]|nr:dihydrolipoyllysine-residue acetyltransferase [Methylobacteriaceae bacterium]
MASNDVTVPDIGDFKNIPVIEIMVKPGDEVSAEAPLIVLESDKATMEVPAPRGGKVEAVLVKVGDKVSEGTPIVRMAGEGAGAAPAAAKAAAPAAQAAAPVAPAPVKSPAAEADDSDHPVAKDDPMRGAPPVPGRTRFPDFVGVNASPAVRRLARELDVDLNKVMGTGDKGRITKDDVKAALGAGKAVAAAAPASGAGIPEIPPVDFSKFGPVETVAMPRIKKISGPFLHRSWLNIPHVTNNDECDITEIDQFRKQLDDSAKGDKKAPYRVSLLPFLMKASVSALKAFPDFNSSLAPDKASLVRKHYWHIGFAADTPDGLVVPVIRDVDQKGVVELSRELGALSEKARAGKLAPTEMQGATFTISSLGGIGGTHFTPIVNAPEVAILGVSRSKMAPVWDGKEFRPRNMLPLSLSYDHRVIDGAAAARFLRHLAGVMEDVRRLIL